MQACKYGLSATRAGHLGACLLISDIHLRLAWLRSADGRSAEASQSAASERKRVPNSAPSRRSASLATGGGSHSRNNDWLIQQVGLRVYAQVLLDGARGLCECTGVSQGETNPRAVSLCWPAGLCGHWPSSLVPKEKLCITASGLRCASTEAMA